MKGKYRSLRDRVARKTSFGVAVERDVFGGIVRPLVGGAMR